VRIQSGIIIFVHRPLKYLTIEAFYRLKIANRLAAGLDLVALVRGAYNAPSEPLAGFWVVPQRGRGEVGKKGKAGEKNEKGWRRGRYRRHHGIFPTTFSVSPISNVAVSGRRHARS